MILSSVELQEYFGEYFSEMIFLLRTYDSPAYKYDSQLDVFVLGDESLTSSVFEFVQSLPSSFDDSKYKEFVEMLEEKDIPLELFEKAFAEEYRKDGLTYHRIKQTLTDDKHRDQTVGYPPGGNRTADDYPGTFCFCEPVRRNKEKTAIEKVDRKRYKVRQNPYQHRCIPLF